MSRLNVKWREDVPLRLCRLLSNGPILVVDFEVALFLIPAVGYSLAVWGEVRIHLDMRVAGEKCLDQSVVTGLPAQQQAGCHGNHHSEDYSDPVASQSRRCVCRSVAISAGCQRRLRVELLAS